MAAFHARVPGLVHFLLLVAAATAVLALPTANGEKENAVRIDLEARERAFPVDYRNSKCMPPISEEFVVETDDCIITFWALPAVSMAEYRDCESSPGKVLRDFSTEQVLECAMPSTYSCFLQNYKKVTDALDYLVYAGIALNTTYFEAEDFEDRQSQVDTCHADKVEVAYKLKKGYRNLKPFDEQRMAKVVKKRGPILVTLYLDTVQIEGFTSYVAGILDSDTFCPRTAADFSFDLQSGSNDGLMYPVMVVGYGRVDGVKVWILRNEWLGQTWGMGGYFYLKRGINACSIAVSPIRVLG